MRYSLAFLISIISFSAQANVLQYFTGLSFNNPAELFKVKHQDLIIGGTSFYVDAGFAGSALNLNNFQYEEGESHTRRVSLLPYGRIAARANEKLVFAIDLTEPFHSNLSWGDNAFTRYAATETFMTDVDLSPKFSFSITPRLYIGAGLNLNFLKNNETNWALPTGPTTYASLINRSSSFGMGYNGGAYFLANASNFLGISYYSSIRQDSRGVSLFDGDINNNFRFNFHFPSTTILNYTHLFNPQWLAGAQIFCTEWNVNQFARLRNTAARPPLNPNFTFTMKYKPSWAYSAFVRNQYNEKLGLMLLGIVDDGPERERLRTINFPSDTQYFLGLSGEYRVSKTATLELLYGHGFSTTTIQNRITLEGQTRPFNTGKVKINADVVDLKFKMQL